MISCVRQETRLVYSCSCEQQAKVASFVKESIQAANNMSDEEMEDVILQLERTGVKLNCSQVYKNVTITDGHMEINGVNSNETVYKY